MKEKLKQLKKQLAEATGAEHVQLNVVDMDFLLTVALAADVEPKAALQAFEQSMGRAARQNNAQKLAINRILRRLETAQTYLSSISERDMTREDLIRLNTARKALAGEFDQ